MVWFNHAFLWLKSRNNTKQQEEIQWHQRSLVDYVVMKQYKKKKFHVSQLSNRVLTCWITKGWRKTTWVKFSASPAVNTNQILIKDVLQVVIKVIKSVKSTSGEISLKTTTKDNGEKHSYVQGVGWATIEVDRMENSGISAILQNVTRI